MKFAIEENTSGKKIKITIIAIKLQLIKLQILQHYKYYNKKLQITK